MRRGSARAVYLALSRAAHFAGHFYVPRLGDRYTANADITDGWSWAQPLMLTATAGLMFAILSIPVAVGLLLTQSVRRRRPLFYALLTGSLLVMATIAAVSSPPGRAIVGWIMD
jgi:hypothetical protein